MSCYPTRDIADESGTMVVTSLLVAVIMRIRHRIKIYREAYSRFAGNFKIWPGKYKMTIKSIVVSILCIMIAGCASLPPVEDNQTKRQVINIYDSKGNVKERMIIKDDYITIYDKDWKRKGYEKVQK